MASGFIILKDGRCFARRWTGYDEILRIAIKELYLIEEGKDLADWLETRIPDLDDESLECGWGFYKNSTGEFLHRYLDIRSLTVKNQELFVKAIIIGRAKIHELKDEYSILNVDFFEIFFEMVALCENGNPPLEFSDWGNIKICNNKNGPGWE